MPSVRSGGRPGRRAKNEINVVPYIDVMLVLLVIFMVTAPLVTPGLINPPSVGEANLEAPRARPLQIEVSKDNVISIRDLQQSDTVAQAVRREELVQAVRQRQASNSVEGQQPQQVVIAADGELNYQVVMTLMADLQREGIGAGLLVQQGPPAK
jgi:biopolymer transport protein TolR